ncbi:MAG TPA: hypothetical protein VGM03_00975, partial [Phycisphaerae bacterium]
DRLLRIGGFTGRSALHGEKVLSSCSQNMRVSAVASIPLGWTGYREINAPIVICKLLSGQDYRI